MHLNNKNSKLLFKIFLFLKGLACKPAGQPLCGAGYKNQPTDSMRGGPTRIATPNMNDFYMSININ